MTHPEWHADPSHQTCVSIYSLATVNDTISYQSETKTSDPPPPPPVMAVKPVYRYTFKALEYSSHDNKIYILIVKSV